MGRFRDEGLVFELPPSDSVITQKRYGRVPLQIISYLDDLTPMVVSAKAADIPKMSGRAAVITNDFIVVTGHKSCWQKNKSKAMLDVCGHESTVVRHQVYNVDDSKIHAVSKYSGDFDIFVTACHKLLGGKIDVKNTMPPEVLYRRGTCMGQMKPFNKQMFSKPFFDVQTKLDFWVLFLQSRLAFNAATWLDLPKTARAAFNSAVVSAYRKICGVGCSRDDEDFLSDLQFRARINAPHGDVIRRMCRLRYLPRLMSFAPSMIISLIELTSGEVNSWMNMVIDDLCWVWDHAKSHFELPNPRDDPAIWFTLIFAWKSRWKCMIKRPFRNASHVQRRDALFERIDCKI